MVITKKTTFCFFIEVSSVFFFRIFIECCKIKLKYKYIVFNKETKRLFSKYSNINIQIIVLIWDYKVVYVKL